MPQKNINWLRKGIQPHDITLKASLPKVTKIHLPIDLFRTFITDSIVAGLVDQTNLHAARKTNARITMKLTHHEMNRFLGVEMVMSTVKLPAMKIYLEHTIRCTQIARATSRVRFLTIRWFFSCNR